MLRFLIATCAFFFCTSAIAQPYEKIATATLVADAPLEHLQAGEPVWVALEMHIREGWHAYWQNPGDSGIPTEIVWQNLPANASASPIHWPVPERQPTGDLVNYGYSNRVVLPVAITVPKGTENITLKAKASWLVCNDICIPESAELEIHLPEISGKETIREALRYVPKLAKQSGLAYEKHGDRLIVSVPRAALAGDTAALRFFPITENIVQNSSTPAISQQEENLALSFTANSNAPERGTMGAVIATDAEHAVQFSDTADLNTLPETAPKPAPEPGPGPALSLGLWLAVALAFAGGLLLNLMPCVLPIVALKAFGIAQKSDAPRARVIAQGASYTLGVLVSMAMLGAAIYVLKTAGESVGWGFQLQSPQMVAALALLMLLVALHLLGHLTLPALFTRTDQSLGTRHGAAGSFFTGCLSVAVATPCTAPFMAPALGAAATMPPLHGLLILLSLGLGLAMPYLLICLWPAARRLLPKPGAWMVRFKEALAFPMLATAAWLIWVLGNLSGPDGTLRVLVAAILIVFSLWLAKGRKGALMRALIVLLAALCTYIGIISQSLAPRATAHASQTVPYSAEALAKLRADGASVFVDVTADWCITCKINERVALRDQAVQQFFHEQNITLMVADWTMRDKAITDYLATFGRNGVPIYVWYAKGKEGVLLPQVLTPTRVLEALSADAP